MKCLMRYLLQIDVKSQTQNVNKKGGNCMITMQNVRKTYGNFIFEMSMELPDGQILG